MVDQLNKDTTGILHCWESTKLLRAWESDVQSEAMVKATSVFPNLVKATRVEHIEDDPGDVQDDEAFDMGEAFTETSDEDEWMGWVDWEAHSARSA